MKKIKNENELLGFMIKHANEYEEFNTSTWIKSFGSDTMLDFAFMLKELELKRYAIRVCANIIQITPSGRENYIPQNVN